MATVQQFTSGIFLLILTMASLVSIYMGGIQLASSIVYPHEYYSFVKKWGSQGTDEGEFMFPQVIGTDQSDNLYILDNTGRVQKFDSNGTFIRTIITIEGSLRPVDGAIDPMGNIYLVSNLIASGPLDNINGTVRMFNSSGVLIREWGSNGTGKGQFNQPLEIAVDSSSSVYVADSWNHRIQKFNSSGVLIREWGSNGTGKGHFNIIHGLDVDSSGNVYVADTKYIFPGNDRIQKFNSNGVFIKEWGRTGEGHGEFNHPMAIALDSSDSVYIADANNNRIQKFDSNGTFITTWGSLCQLLDQNAKVNSSQLNNATSGCMDSDGRGPNEKGDGQFQVPVSVEVDSNVNVYVSDLTSRIQKFRSR